MQDVFARHPPCPVNVGKSVRNPFLGLVRCSIRGCITKSTHVSVVEEAVLATLGQWLADFQVEADALLVYDETKPTPSR